MTRPKVRLDGGDPADLVLYGGGSINASATVQSGDTLITLPFDSSAAIPLITRGCILDPGDNDVHERAGCVVHHLQALRVLPMTLNVQDVT